MEAGLVVYNELGGRVFDQETRTLKIVKRIPFTKALRNTTTVHQDPLFASEDPTWLYTGGLLYSNLIQVSYDNDKMIVRVNTFYKSKRNGDLYEDPDANNRWDSAVARGAFILLAVY